MRLGLTGGKRVAPRTPTARRRGPLSGSTTVLNLHNSALYLSVIQLCTAMYVFIRFLASVGPRSLQPN